MRVPRITNLEIRWIGYLVTLDESDRIGWCNLMLWTGPGVRRVRTPWNVVPRLAPRWPRYDELRA